MSEFKGTKGKWISNYQVGSWLIQDLETYQDGYKGSIAEVYYFDDGNDTAELNALLISKAPEMLEILIELREIFDKYRVDNEQQFSKYKQTLEKIIKEATELN